MPLPDPLQLGPRLRRVLPPAPIRRSGRRCAHSRHGRDHDSWWWMGHARAHPAHGGAPNASLFNDANRRASGRGGGRLCVEAARRSRSALLLCSWHSSTRAASDRLFISERPHGRQLRLRGVRHRMGLPASPRVRLAHQRRSDAICGSRRRLARVLGRSLSVGRARRGAPRDRLGRRGRAFVSSRCPANRVGSLVEPTNADHEVLGLADARRQDTLVLLDRTCRLPATRRARARSNRRAQARSWFFHASVDCITVTRGPHDRCTLFSSRHRHENGAKAVTRESGSCRSSAREFSIRAWSVAFRGGRPRQRGHRHARVSRAAPLRPSSSPARRERSTA
jgi:hypothetical protein